MCFILFQFIFIISASAQSNFVVVVNAENEIETMSEQEVSDIFLKKMVRWEDNSKIKPVDREKTAEIREIFSKEIHGKSVNAIIGYWQKKIFSGRGVPLVEKSSEDQVIAYIQSNKSAIGYVSSSASLPKEIKAVKLKK